MDTSYLGKDPPAPSSITPDGARIVTGGAQPAGPGPYVMSCGTLVGDTVVNRKDEDLGTLEHILIEVASGRIAYAVLACGGVFGLGEKLFAIPWGAFTLDADRNCFVLNIDKEKLEAAPGFDPDHWPSTADNAWVARIHDYYGVRAA